jgi:hypothetical protein
MKQKAKPAEILRRSNIKCGEETLSCASVYDWYSKFSESRKADFGKEAYQSVRYCSKSLRNDVHQAVRKTRPGKLRNIVMLLHENAHQHTANLRRATLATGAGKSRCNLLTALTQPPIIFICLDQ